MDVFFFDVDVVKEILPHEAHITLLRVGFHRVIFIEVEGDHIFETEPFLFVHAHQFLVHLNRRGAGSKTQHNVLSFLLPLANA